MNWIPLAIMFGLSMISLGIGIEKHGQTTNKTHNAWDALICQAIWWGLVVWTVFG